MSKAQVGRISLKDRELNLLKHIVVLLRDSGMSYDDCKLHGLMLKKELDQLIFSVRDVVAETFSILHKIN